MNALLEMIQQNITGPLAAFFGGLTSLVIAILVFREQLVELLSKFSPSLAKLLASVVQVDVSVIPGVKFQFYFGQQVQKLIEQAKPVAATVAASRVMPAPNPARELGNQTARDLVLSAWGALQQIVYDACTVSKLPLTPATRIPEAVQRLVRANVINAEVASLLGMLYKLGQELADDTALRPLEEDARGYQELADVVVDWMMLSVIAPGNGEPPKPVEELRARRQTQVAGHFPPPQAGAAVALLVGIGGPVRGQRFSMNKASYRIGSNADNDLRITEDSYVSGNHALLRYEKGTLFLVDQGSRNGSFLNEKQITGAPVMVQRGDQIRLGTSVFQVAETPTPQAQPRQQTAVL